VKLGSQRESAGNAGGGDLLSLALLWLDGLQAASRFSFRGRIRLKHLPQADEALAKNFGSF